MAAPPLAASLALLAVVIAVAIWRGTASALGHSMSTWVARRAVPLLQGSGAWQGLRLGLVMGFLPCGAIYGALAVAASSGDARHGAILMLAFGSGTMPGLIAVGTAGRALWRLSGRSALAMPMAVNAALLGFSAWRVWMAA